jgi:NADH-quinone oxidoreductase subunit E
VAERAPHPDTPELRERWGNFAWTEENAAKAKEAIKRYPEGRQRSAVMPLLDLAQRQIGAETNTQGWLPIPVIEFVARELDMPVIRVLEVATFYTMYNLAPVGRHVVQVCTTTPCWLRGSEQVVEACKKALGVDLGGTTPDGQFTLREVDCLGACVNAPMAQIGDDYYEDLDAQSMTDLIETLKRGETPKPGPQVDRQTSAPVGGATTLKDVPLKQGT